MDLLDYFVGFFVVYYAFCRVLSVGHVNVNCFELFVKLLVLYLNGMCKSWSLFKIRTIKLVNYSLYLELMLTYSICNFDYMRLCMSLFLQWLTIFSHKFRLSSMFFTFSFFGYFILMCMKMINTWILMTSIIKSLSLKLILLIFDCLCSICYTKYLNAFWIYIILHSGFHCFCLYDIFLKTYHCVW